MNERSYRILVAQLFQETHGFTPLSTPIEAFEIELGDSMLMANENADSVLGGILRTFKAHECIAVPSLAARARPGGRVEDTAYTFIRENVLEAARKGGYDAIALCLHGCTQTESLDSAEEDLLEKLRALVGPTMPIVAGFDLHAHAIPSMLRHLTFSSAYKTNPHGDAAATGERVATELLRIMNGGEKPTGTFAHIPMLTRGNDETAHGPLADIHQTAKNAIDSIPGLLDVSIFNVNPFIDGNGVGQSVVVYSLASAQIEARQLTIDLAQGLWDQRDQYVHQLPSVDDVLLEHTTNAEKLIIGDFGDRVLAGAPGDSLYVLQRACALTSKRIAAVVTDPDAFDYCEKSGVGTLVTLKAGAKYSPGCSEFTVSGEVKAVGEGTFRNRGAFMKGATLRLGRYVVLRNPRYDLLITRDAIMSQDPGCYIDAGIDLNDVGVIVTKSGYHFKLAFNTLGKCICAETPGLSGYHPKLLPFSKARPIFPLDEFSYTADCLDLH